MRTAPDSVEAVKGEKPVFGEKKSMIYYLRQETDKECLQAA
jgi:hypothetical protein